MTTFEYTTRVLNAEEGKVLTQSADVELMKRVFSPQVYLAVNDNPDSWKEITVEEAEKLQKEQQSILEKELKEKQSK